MHSVPRTRRAGCYGVQKYWETRNHQQAMVSGLKA
jgi:hypothetical protein